MKGNYEMNALFLFVCGTTGLMWIFFKLVVPFVIEPIVFGVMDTVFVLISEGTYGRTKIDVLRFILTNPFIGIKDWYVGVTPNNGTTYEYNGWVFKCPYLVYKKKS